jgi:hypothetical protein
MIIDSQRKFGTGFKIKDNNFSIDAYEKHLQEQYLQQSLAQDSDPSQSLVRMSNFKSIKKLGRGDQSHFSDFITKHHF